MLLARDVNTARSKDANGAVALGVHAGRNVILAAALLSLIACAPARNVAYVPVQAVESAPTASLLKIKKDIDLVRLEGVLSSPEQVARVNDLAADLFGADMIINDLKVDPELAAADWLDNVMLTAGQMQDVEGFSLVAGSGHMTVGGEVDSAARADQIAQSASDMAGLTLAVSSTLSYPVEPESQIAAVGVNVIPEPDESVAAGAVDGVSVAIVPIAAIEQQAVAVQSAAMQAIPAVSVAGTAVPVIEVAASVKKVGLDSDHDGITDAVDACDSRPGYPVDERGCQVLDGYLKDVRFYGDAQQLTDAAKISLDKIVDIMQAHPVSKIAVLSYSKDGSPTLMRTQARRRAHSVVDYLIGKGITQNRLQAFALAHRQGVNPQILIKEVD